MAMMILKRDLRASRPACFTVSFNPSSNDASPLGAAV
jgi:hypothetical protein